LDLVEVGDTPASQLWVNPLQAVRGRGSCHDAMVKETCHDVIGTNVKPACIVIIFGSAMESCGFLD
jgi:hypothetical protein